MFKLESYITPILLSYVDKYIKNFRPEDSQVSLWGGDASFHNLDLRLEVLEQELKLPFSFVSGHIHELTIHVPWTKLASEPIHITINTIECTLKLRGEDSNCSDGASTHVSGGSSNAGTTKDGRKKTPKKQELVAPPGYVQSLVNKIVSNITIVCNNLILKYVEEDIVLSVNVKTVTLQSANELWEAAYTELSSSQIKIRKLVNLVDLTICLDKRNASGKIELYQEPLLYRCSMEVHLLRTYHSLTAKSASTTRIDCKCDRMDFSLSEEQIPMFMRLMKLALALHARELRPDPATAPEETNEIVSDDYDLSEGGQDESWAGWAWSWVPSLLPTDWDEDWSNEQQVAYAGHTCHSCMYIAHASISFKVTEQTSERSYYGPKKVKFVPFLDVQFKGSAFELVTHGKVWLNAQMGVSEFFVQPHSNCFCGVKDTMVDHDKPESREMYFIHVGTNQENYLSDSLFDPTSVENRGVRRQYRTSWDFHTGKVTESSLLERTPALAMDYLYQVDLPEDYSMETLSEMGSDLEYSNLSERTLCRVVIGQTLVVKLCSGLIHRLQMIKHATKLYDYSPYSVPKQEPSLEELPPASSDDFDALNEYIPTVVLQVTAFRPTIHFHLNDHPNYDPAVYQGQHRKRRSTSRKPSTTCLVDQLPVFSVECGCLDASLTRPMYPRRLVTTACKLPTPPPSMFDACHNITKVKIFEFCAQMILNPNVKPTTIVKKSNFSYNQQRLLMPQYWSNLDLFHCNRTIDAEESITVVLTNAKMLVISYILQSLVDPAAGSDVIYGTTLLRDAAKNSGVEYLEVYVEACSYRQVTTPTTVAYHVKLGAVRAFVLDLTEELKNLRECHQVLVLSGPEVGCADRVWPANVEDKPLLTVTLQCPLDPDNQAHPPLVVCNVREVRACVDPLLWRWLRYSPTFLPGAADVFPKVTIPKELPGTRVRPSTADSKRTAQSDSVHSSSEKLVRSLEGRPRSDSAKREAITVATNTSERLLRYAESTNKPGWDRVFLLRWFPVWRGLVISGDVAHCVVYLPTATLSAVGVRTIEEALDRYDREVLVVKFPHVTLRSAAQRQGLHLYTDRLPVVVPEDVWLPDKISFPWTLSFANASCYTIQAGIQLHFLKPVSANTTITISNKYQSESQDKLTSLNLCVYVDTTPVKVAISETQMFLMSSVLVGLMDVASAFTLHNTTGPLVTEVVMRPQSPTSPTTYQESSLSRDTPSYPRVKQSRPEIDMHAAPSTTEASRPDVVNLTSLFQWTLARLMVTLYIDEVDKPNGDKFKLQLDLEDIMSSLELQDIFKKLKCKVAAASIQHFRRGPTDRRWHPGTYLGQVMRGNEEISTDDESSGFVSLLYTRARSKNVHNKWGTVPNRKNRKPSFTQPAGENAAQPVYPICAESHYISEIVVKLQAVDFILSPDTLSTFTQALQPLHLVPRRRHLRTHRSPGLYHQINNHTLPLLYVETKAIRVILPSVQMMDLQGVHDVCLIQLESISLAPQAENPLGRVVIRADLYAKAERSRTLTVPGADIEDRQYQLNISEFSISTGRWEDLNKCLSVSYDSPRTSLKTMSENPAVAWNSLVSGGEGITPHIQLTPVIARIKLCIIVAPAIVDRNFILVCGHSFELNSLTDIEVSVSTSQLFLISTLLKETMELVSPLLEAKDHVVNQDVTSSISNERLLVITEYQASKDSGNIDSASFASPMHRLIFPENASIQEKSSGYYEGDSSSNVFLRRTTTPTLEASPEIGERNCETIPVEVLITAGSIKFVLYEVMDGSQEELQKILDRLKEKEASLTSRSDSSHSKQSNEDLNVGSIEVRAQPMVYVLLAQPHVFISRHCHEKKAQMSCFDFGIRTSTKENSLPFPEIPTVADFPEVLLETKNGDPHPTTGIPPSFLTCKWTQAEGKLGKVEIEMGRPMRLNCSLSRWGFLNAVSAKVLECFKQHKNHYSSAFTAQSVHSPAVHSALKAKAKKNLLYFESDCPRSIGTNTSIPEEQETGSFDSAECTSEDVQSDYLHQSVRAGKVIRTEQRFKGTLFSKVSAIAITTQQIVLDAQTTYDVEIMLSLSRLSCSLTSMSGRDRVTGNVALDCLTAALRSGRRTRLLVNPWSCSAHACLAWEPWLSRDAPPQLHLTADSDCFIVDIGPERLRCLHAVWTEYKPFLDQLSSSEHLAEDKAYDEDKFDETMGRDQEQQYRDDLRAGAFQFVEASGSREDLPLPYQVVFWQDPPTMAWRYPQPRALTRVDVFPVPFKVANLSKKNQQQQVFCWLQYWSEVRSRFLPYSQFTLSESEVRRLELPGQTVACTWRVQLALTGEDDEDLTSVRLSINPKTLAACMRVDSFFSPKLIPQMQAALNVSSIIVTVYNHVTGSRPMPEPLQNFAADGLVPEMQVVLTGQLNNASLYISKWASGRQMVDVASHIRLDIVDYAYLTQQCVVEPFRGQATIDVDEAIDISCVTKPITVRFSSAAAHTIAVSSLLWSQALREFQVKKGTDPTKSLAEPQVVLSRYVICNDMMKSIRFGQAGTDEDILLESRTCHLYAWRSQKASQMMKVGIEGQWTWCEPFPIDVDGIKSLLLQGFGKLHLVVKVTSLSSTQKQVTIGGQFTITNLLVERFDCRVLELDQEAKDSQFIIVDGHSTPPSVLIDSEKTVAMRIRFSGMLGATWSGDIPLRLNVKPGSPWLVKVPISDRGYIFMWCHIIKGQGGCVLAALYPLYSIRSLLPVTARVVVYTPGLKVYMQTDIKGNGAEQPLYCPGTIDHAHTLTFQLEPAPPTPPVPLSYSMLERRKMSKIDGESLDVQEVIKALHSTTEPKGWPFAGEDYADVEWTAPPQPETDIRVHYESKGPYCATLQVQIQPWALFLNSLGCSVDLVVEDLPTCRIPHLGVLTPPRLESTFHLDIYAIEKPYGIYRSPSLQLHKPGLSFYMPRIAGFIPVVGNMQVAVLCGFTVALASISSALVPEDGEMRVIHLKPNFVMSNKTKHKIRVSCFAVRNSDCNRQLPVAKSQVVVKVPQSELGGTPLIHWKILDEGDAELVPYMMISVGSKWSAPLVANQKVIRRGFSVPLANGSDEPYVMTMQERNGQTFYSIHHEKHPHVVVNNNCLFALLIAEGNAERKGPLVQNPHLDCFSIVEPGCYSHYSLPSLMEKFPTIEQFPRGTNMVFARANSRKDDGNTTWSSGISISETQEQFVRLPGHGDVKIRVEVVCLTVHITLDTVSHVEISARDIRSRLTQQQYTKLSTKGSPATSVQGRFQGSVQGTVCDDFSSVDDAASLPPSVVSFDSHLEEYEKVSSVNETKISCTLGSPMASVASETLSSPRIVKSSSSQILENFNDFNEPAKKIVRFNCFIRGFSLTLIENLQGARSEQTEVTSLSLDNVSVSLEPQIVSGVVNDVELILIIGDIQLDNQMCQRGGFDFPVVLTTQTPNRDMPAGFSLGIPARQLAQKMISTGIIYLSITFDRTNMASKNVKLSIGPIAAYIEDTFLMKLSESLLCFLPHYLILMPEAQSSPTPNVQIPLSINLYSHEIANPLRLQSLTIDPINVLLSIHASLKLYLALDRTPLSFNLFHAGQLETTPYRLGHKLTVHYVSGALFGAGWVVGSLELLGSPGGLARTLGSGIKDFVSMPCRGILQGPWGFLSGATQGSASLFRHCAAGAVGSVTGLASSVARNLDRLTLDKEHLLRTEELRRTRPQGIGQGIAQGLSGLGINLLGAVGGIAHHPLQAAMSDTVTTRNVAAGVGLGLVGVLTKPLSGAAELVALAGRGLLNGTGWDNQPEPRSQPIIEHAFTGVNSRLKYGWKLSTGSDLLHVVEASCATVSGSYEAVALVLTTRALFLIDTDKDTTRRVLSLSELTGIDNPSDPTLLCFTICQSLESDPLAASRARVEHFVRFSSGLITEGSLVEQQDSPTSLSGSPVSSSNPMDAPLMFYVNPQSRNYFLTILELAKRQSQGRGFNLL